MSQLCVHRDMKHLGSLESTQEAGVALGYASSNSYACSPNFPRASYLDERTLTHESIVKLGVRIALKIDAFRHEPLCYLVLINT